MSDFQPNTTFYLLKGVKIDHSYTNTIDFLSKEEQYNYFFSKKAFEVLEGTYQRKTVGVINLPFLYDDIADCNYIMWQNGNYSDKWYYAFILEIKYLNPNLSQIVYDLDVIQTYMFDIKWEKSQIDRDMSQLKPASDQKPSIINREVEDLDYGSDYDLKYEEEVTVLPNVSFIVIGCTNTSNDSAYGQALRGIPLNIKYYFFPISTLSNADAGPTLNFKLNQGTLLTDAWKALKAFQSDTKLVNSAVSVKLYPFFPAKMSRVSVSGYTMTLSCNVAYSEDIYTNEYGTLNAIVLGGNTSIPAYEYTLSRGKYCNIVTYDEDKMYMFPYTYGVLTNKRGQDLIIKLEDVDSDDITIKFQGSVSSEPKLGYIVKKLNIARGSLIEYDQTQGIVESILNDYPIVDDYTASYMQSNSNSIRVANANAKLAQQSALDQANNTYNTSSTILDNKRRQASTNLGLDLARGSINAIAVGAQATGGKVTGLAMGAVAGLASLDASMISSAQTYQNTQESIRNNALLEANTLKNANISANTDYQVAIASTNAKVQDAKCVPPTAKQLGGDYIFDVLHECNTLYFQLRTVKDYYANKLQLYWKRYGYRQNAFRLPNLRNRKYWNYIKCVQANIYGNIPQTDLLSIRDIYMSGITIWHTDDIGNYDKVNENAEV